MPNGAITPASSLAVQLDDRPVFLERWRSLLSEVIESDRTLGHHDHDAAHEVLAAWSGHAAPGDAAYRLVQLFRAQIEARAFFMLIAPARRNAQDFRFEIPSSFEGPLWRLMRQRPMNLLASDYADWNAFLLEALLAAERLPAGCHDLASCSWDKVNAVRVAHPPSAALPLVSWFLDMPTVLVAGGRADMPGGQSGHPLSPFYRAGFAAWAQGEATPFLPGPAAHALILEP
jgi:penicillin amidase